MVNEADNSGETGADPIRRLLSFKNRVHLSDDELADFRRKLKRDLDFLVDAGRLTHEVALKNFERIAKDRSEKNPTQLEAEFMAFIDRLKNRQA